MSMTCKVCNKRSYSEYCVSHKPRRAIKKRGKRTIEYEQWRDTVAKPYLDEKFGKKCVECGTDKNLHIDHKKNRGSHYSLKMVLSNVQYLCATCHQLKTDRINTRSTKICEKCQHWIPQGHEIYHKYCQIAHS